MGDSISVQHLLTHLDWTRELARSLVRDPHTADDIAQEAVLVAMRRDRTSIGDLRSWLRRVVGNLVRRRVRTDARRRTREVSAARSDATASAASLVERADTHRHLVSIVLDLGDPHRTVLLQRYFEGLLPRDIARLEKCAVSTISNRLTRAHAALRTRLRAEDRDWRAAVLPLVAERASVSSSAAAATVLFSMKAVAAVAVAVAAALSFWWFRAPTPELPPRTVTPLVLEDDAPSGDAPVAGADDAMRETVEVSNAAAAVAGKGTFAVRLVDARSSAPLSNAGVRLRREGAPEDAPSWYCAVDEDGVCAFDALPAGELRAEIELDGEVWLRREESVQVVAEESRAVEWSLALDARVRGRLVDGDGNPVVSETVVIARPRSAKNEFGRKVPKSRLVADTKTDAYGQFVFDGVEAGRYVVGPRGDLFTREASIEGLAYMKRRANPPAPYLVEVVVPKNEPEVEIEVRVWNDLFISGSIRFPDGRPADDVLLLATLRGTSGSLRADSRQDGSFRFGPMPPGTYSIFDNHGPEGWGVFQRVRVAAGTEGVQLVLRRAGMMSGTIVDTSAGKPVKGWVRIQQADTGPSPRTGVAMQTVCDPDGGGTFRIDSLEPANYHITFTSDDREWFGFLSNVTAQSGRELSGIEVPLQRAAQLTIEHKAEEGRLRIDIEHDGMLFLDWLLGPGESATLAVPPGEIECVLEHRASGVVDRRKLEAKAREESAVVFEPR